MPEHVSRTVKPKPKPVVQEKPKVVISDGELGEMAAIAANDAWNKLLVEQGASGYSKSVLKSVIKEQVLISLMILKNKLS